MAGFAATRWSSLVRNQARVEAENFPAPAADYLRSHPMPSRLFAHYDWGGYAIWKLYPAYDLFVDGRADLYGDDLLGKFQQALQVKAGWNQVLDSCGVESVLVPPSSPLAQALLLDSGWKPEYRDQQAVLLVRIPSPGGGSGLLPLSAWSTGK
jgi:hypothetical protein